MSETFFEETKAYKLEIDSTPNPSLFTLLLAMADNPSFPVELIPVSKSSKLIEQLNGEAGSEVSITYVAANQLVQGKTRPIKLTSVVYWPSF